MRIIPVPTHPKRPNQRRLALTLVWLALLVAMLAPAADARQDPSLRGETDTQEYTVANNQYQVTVATDFYHEIFNADNNGAGGT